MSWLKAEASENMNGIFFTLEVSHLPNFMGSLSVVVENYTIEKINRNSTAVLPEDSIYEKTLRTGCSAEHVADCKRLPIPMEL